MENGKTAASPVSFSEFPLPSYEDWKAAAKKTLKGADFDKKLLTKTFEGITLRPIYNQQDVEDSGALPGQPGYRRGSLAAGYLAEGCKGLSPLDAGSPAEANAQMREELANGASGLSLRLAPAAIGCACACNGGLALYTAQDAKTLFAGIDLAGTELQLYCGLSALPALSLLCAADIGLEKAKGSVAASPLAVLAASGSLPRPLAKLYDEMAESLRFAEKAAPGLRTVLCQGAVFTSGGADSVTELALVLAQASEYLAALTERGIDIDTAAQSLCLALSVGSNYFMEIAKLRAARVLYSHLVKAFGGSEEAGKAHIVAETAAFSKTVYDPYVNVLRSTTEAFSALVGGAQNLTVAPFDSPLGQSDEASRRIARNIPILLKEEFELSSPVDPAGGSWYVETLTNQVIEAVWQKFTAIEAEGGLLKALLLGSVQKDIAEKLADKKKKLNTRSLRAVGVNLYANMGEVKLSRPAKACASAAPAAKNLVLSGGAEELVSAFKAGENIASVNAALGGGCGESCTAIAPHRLTEDFEALRDKTAQMGGVKIFLANMGPLTQHKARADFSAGFFEVGGFTVESPAGFESVEDAAKAAKASGAAACVICSTDDSYPELVPPLAKAIKAQSPGTLVLVAGAPAPEHKEAYLAAGVWDFIHIRANCYEILKNIQAEGGN